MKFKLWLESEQPMIAQNGVPVYLYHGTPHYPFDKMKYRDHYPRHGFYFTDRPDHAGRYSMYNGGDDGGFVLRVKVNLKNPKRVTKEEVRDLVTEKDVEKAQAEGYDGFIVWDEKQNRAYEYVVFNPDNIQIVDYKFVPKGQNVSSWEGSTPHGQKQQFPEDKKHFVKWILEWTIGYDDNPHDMIPDFENMERYLRYMGPKSQRAFVQFLSYIRSLLPKYQNPFDFDGPKWNMKDNQKGLAFFSGKDLREAEKYLVELQNAVKEEMA